MALGGSQDSHEKQISPSTKNGKLTWLMLYNRDSGTFHYCWMGDRYHPILLR